MATVIDFGVAKAIQQPLIDEQVETKAFQVLGTPKFMSPEQVDCDVADIDTRSDVYSLGVVLYNLLVGQMPYQEDSFTKGAYFNIVQTIRDSEIIPPSTQLAKDVDAAERIAVQCQTDVRTLRRLLRSDLDWVVLKCLEKDRSDRYETASALAADIQHFLEHEPVTARQSSFTYNLKKFALRYKGRVFAASLVVFALGIGLISSLVLYGMAQRRAEEVLRLSDIQLLNSLETDLKKLPATDYSIRKSEMQAWLDRAQPVVLRLPIHQQTLARFEQLRDEILADSADLDNSSEDEPFAFENPEQQWEYENLGNLVAELTEFRGENGALARVQTWIERTPSAAAIDKAWEVVIADVDEVHSQSHLTRLPYLFPFRKNPQTGLWEFVDLRFGLMPRVDESGKVIVSSETGVIFVLVNGGTFQMGSPPDEIGHLPEESLHEVTISPFFISKYEMTIDHWLRAGYDIAMGEPELMVPVSTTWFKAYRFCRRFGYALPTEAQWEFACRAGTTGPYSGTGVLDEMGWFLENSDDRLHRVGEKHPNQFGLYDMHGNSIEWCFDRYDPNFYLSALATGLNPVNPPGNIDDNGDVDESLLVECVIRGGPFLGKAAYARSGDRFSSQQNTLIKQNGFRPVIHIPVRSPANAQLPASADTL